MLRRAALACLVLAPLAHAAAAAAGAPGAELFTLGAIEVTDRRDSPAEVRIDRLEAAALRAGEHRDLAAALPALPGVALVNVGDRNEALVSVRGFDSRQVPLFLDGVPVYVPYDGNVDLRRFATADLALITVAKGFSSVLLGPNALGGAINLVSRRPVADREGALSAFAGTSGLRGLEARLGGRRGAWYAQAFAGYEARDTFPLPDGFTPTAAEDGGDRENAFRRDRKASFKVGFVPRPGDEHAASVSIQRGAKGTPPYAGHDARQRVRFWRWPQWDKTSAYYVGSVRLGDGYVKARVYHDTFVNTLDAFDNATYTTQRLGSSFRSLYDDYTWGGALEGGLPALGTHRLKAALHAKRDVHREHNVGQAVQTMRDETASLALEDTWRLRPGVTVIAGASAEGRRSQQADDRAGAGFVPFPGNRNTTLNPQAGLFLQPAGDATWHVTLARKTRFPTLKDRYSYRLGQALPNPTLRPERAFHAEAGYAGAMAAGLRLRVALFHSELNDAILQVDDVARTAAGAPLFQLRNFGRVRNRGAEVTVTQAPAGWLRWSASYTHLDRSNRSAPSIRLLDTPRHRARLDAELKPHPRVTFLPSLEYATDRHSTTYGIIAPGYALAQLQVRVTAARGLTWSAGIGNAFGRLVQLREGYSEAGREFVSRLECTF